MQLYLLRHGIAEDQPPDPADGDAGRRLTDEGRRKTRQAARGLARLIDRPQVILSSPKVRARQTAEYAAAALGAPVEVEDVLAGGDLDAVLERLRQRREASILLVGHEPMFSELIVRLCAGGGRNFIELKKAGLAAMDVPASGEVRGRATLRILLPASVLRAAG